MTVTHCLHVMGLCRRLCFNASSACNDGTTEQLSILLSRNILYENVPNDNVKDYGQTQIATFFPRVSVLTDNSLPDHSDDFIDFGPDEITEDIRTRHPSTSRDNPNKRPLPVLKRISNRVARKDRLLNF
ncbi:hypothetical protein AVEN_165933-1 [Araneus ventricosus]|uniref:Uncharacterized protein n=1 Tax=Araneus ventricosus TaxID=182803 RepID=A0A4Y2Q2X7_ARAVE|nr:hypothetical protein AVEN_165933-1 [Araneus ventricosus]